MIIFKWNPLICEKGDGGGSGGGLGGEGIGGNTGGEGPGFGGIGSGSSGPGIGPGSAGGNPGLAGASGGQNSGMGSGFGGASPSGGDLEGDLAALGISIATVASQVAQGQAESTGNLSFAKIAQNQYSHIKSDIPTSLAVAAQMVGIPVSVAIGLASIGHAATVVSGGTPGNEGAGNHGGPGDAQYWTNMIQQGQGVASQAGIDTSAVAKVVSDFGDSGTGEGSEGGLLTQTNYTYNANDPEIWTDYVNSFYDQALNELRNQSGQYADNTKGYTDRTQGLLDQNQGYLDRLMGEIEGNKTSNLPTMTRMVGGQEVTWVPKPNRDAALQDTNAALGLMDRQDKFINTGMNTAETDFRNKQAFASLGNPTLNYLEKLKELVNQETTISGKDKGIAVDQRQLDQREPGMLEYIKGAGTAAEGISKIIGLL